MFPIHKNSSCYAFQKNYNPISTEVKMTPLLWLCLHFCGNVVLNTFCMLMFSFHEMILDYHHENKLSPKHLSRSGPKPQIGDSINESYRCDHL